MKHDKRFWLFEDWAELLKDDIPAFLNLWYVYTLEKYVSLLEIAGDETEISGIRAQISNHRQLILNYYFDHKTGLLHSCLCKSCVPLGNHSVHDQVLALLLTL